MPISIDGTGSVSGLSDTGLPDVIADGIFIKNIQNVSSDETLSGTYNWGSFGPISIDTGVTVTISTGATWSIV
tara:strand:+ start:564 stop:782 length:219 start_codon:yes stop_codon:yes gene_type:complete